MSPTSRVRRHVSDGAVFSCDRPRLRDAAWLRLATKKLARSRPSCPAWSVSSNASVRPIQMLMCARGGRSRARGDPIAFRDQFRRPHPVIVPELVRQSAERPTRWQEYRLTLRKSGGPFARLHSILVVVVARIGRDAGPAVAYQSMTCQTNVASGPVNVLRSNSQLLCAFERGSIWPRSPVHHVDLAPAEPDHVRPTVLGVARFQRR